MANDKSGKQFLNFKNGRNKRKHDHYQLDGFEDKIFFFERPTKARGPRKERSHLKIFWDRSCENETGVKQNSKNT